ncbi:ankyrin repeat-containing domain protein [Aspergillus aurantiobrunneus]
MSVSSDSASVVSNAGDEKPEVAAAQLTLVNTVPAQSDKDDEVPDLDIIHVVGVDPERRLGLDTVVGSSVSSRKREFVFQCDIPSLLLGDLVFDKIEAQALELLGGIQTSSDEDEAVPPARIFITYDLGALIVKKAIAIASLKEPQWPGIFYSTVHFIFWDCFQRRRDLPAFDAKLWQFLHRHKGNTPWSSLVTPVSIRALAEATVNTTEIFLGSRITLRTRVISIYDSEGSEETDPIFDFFTATLGVSTEVAVQEKPDSQNEPVSDLEKKVCYRAKNWVNHPEWTALQRMILPLTLPQHQNTVEKPEFTHKVLESKAYKDWAATPSSPVLYIQGRNAEHSRSLADNVFLFQQSKLRENPKDHTPTVSFSFSSHDPARATMNSMIASTVIQALCAFRSQTPHPKTDVFFDLYHLQRGWTVQDLHQILFILLDTQVDIRGLLVLHDVDECEPASRKAFWDLVQHLAENSNIYIKVIVTSRRRLSLVSDKTTLWYLYDYSEDKLEETSSSPMLQSPYIDGLVSGLCPAGHGEAQVRKSLEALATMGQTNLEQILRLIQDHTSWPDTPSPHAWSSFCKLLDQVELSTSPARVLDFMLRSILDQQGLQWVLHWLVYGYRPLSGTELAWLLSHCNRGEGYGSFSTLTPANVEEYLRLLKTWLPALVQFGYEKVCIREPLWDILLQDSTGYVWNEIEPSAHQNMLEFISNYLTTPEVRDRLTEIFEQYILLYNADGKHITPALRPDGKDFTFYAVTAFPYHLEEAPRSLQQLEHILFSPDQPLTPWAKVYWAMSNPFSRPPLDTIVSAVAVLLTSANLDTSFRKALKDARAASLDSSGLSNTQQGSDGLAAMDSLVRSLSIGNEEAALKYAQRIILESGGGKGTDQDSSATTKVQAERTFWPSALLWRAAWLNMDRLAGLLLENQMCPDPQDVVSARYPSPLYIASLLGHTGVVRALLKAGANTRVLRGESDGVLFAAAANGHSDIVRSLVAKDRDLLEKEQPTTPLYIASVWDQWETAKLLIDLGARPDYDPASDGWTPLIGAADSGYTQTVRILLENGANPNLCGPGEQDTSLWFAVMRAKSVECVRALLEYDADPNHEFLQPPLVIEICSSSEISPEKKIDLLEALVNNTPPIDIDKVDSNGTTGLMWAASSGNTALVEFLIAQGANVSATDDDLRGPLYYAVINGHREIIKKLLAKGAPVNSLTKAETTLLQLSVEKGVEQVSMLLDAGANPELENGDGLTVLNAAVVEEKPEVVKLLLDRKVDINHRDRADWSPIHDASAYCPNAEIVRLLADAGANLTETAANSQSPLHLAASKPRPDIVAVLLEFRGTLDIEQRNGSGETPLIKAVMSGNMECIRRLLHAGADINAQCSDGWTPLMRAIYIHEPHDVVSFLLSRPGLDISRVSVDQGAALHMACKTLNLTIVKQLLEKHADVNQQAPGIRPTPLMAACMATNIADPKARGENLDKIHQVVKTLVAHRANVRFTTHHPISNLLCAAALGSGPSTINYLVSEGLSLKERGCLNRLPVHYAAVNGRENFETVLLSDGDLLSEDIAGKSALHWAAQFGHVQTVEIILAHLRSPEERRKHLNKPDIDGWTPLCWALRPHPNSNLEMYAEPYDINRTVQILIEGGADVCITCRMGREDETFTALELAKLHSASDEIISLLNEADPDQTTRSIRPYKDPHYNCDICLGTIWGPVRECESCADFYACKKCYGRIDLYHGHIKEESGEPHSFKLLAEVPPEIQEPSESGDGATDGGSKASSPRKQSSDETGRGDGAVVVDRNMEAIMNFSVDDDFGDITIDDSGSRVVHSP